MRVLLTTDTIFKGHSPMAWKSMRMSSFPWTFFIVVLFLSIDKGLGFRCLSCKGTLEPWMCKVSRTCNNDENVCGLRRYRGSGGELVYDTFCSNDTKCGFGIHSICDKCCHGDMCNVAGCGSSGYPPNHGRICYSCNQVTDLSLCADIEFCNQGHVCAVFNESLFGRYFYTSKCLPAYACGEGETAIFGKRQSSETLCGPCCDVDFCNDKCNDNSPHAISETNMEFLLMFPNVANVDKLYVLISSTSPGQLNIDVPYISMKKTIFLSKGTNYIKFNRTLSMTPGVAVANKAIYLKSNVSITVFGIVDRMHDNWIKFEETEGFMVLPVEKLGLQYRAIRCGDYDGDVIISVASLYDNTTVNVQFEMNSSIISLSGLSYQYGDTRTVTLQRLDTLNFEGNHNLTGTSIRSDKPIAMIGGSSNSLASNPDLEFLPPVSKLGTTFIIPPFPETPLYYVRLLLASDGADALVVVTHAKGTHRYRINYTDISTEIIVDSGPSFVTSTRPIYVTIQTYQNQSIPSALVSIPSVSNYRNDYTIPSPNSITPHGFDQYTIIVIPSSKQSGLRVNNSPIHSTSGQQTLQVHSTTYTFLTVPMDGPLNVITHADNSVKFGAFIFGIGQFKPPNGRARYAFPAGFQ